VSELKDYCDKYPNVRFERDDDGVLTVTLHAEGQPVKWSDRVHHDLPEAFYNVAQDLDNRVVILTGAGDAFIDGGESGSFQLNPATPPVGIEHIYREGLDLLLNLLKIRVPVIVAVNGPAYPHAELGLLGDVVLATKDTTFRDFHFEMGVAPGDGVHVVWPLLLGMNRGRYYLMTSKPFTAQEAFEWGVVNEVLDRAALLPRARELAATFAAQPPLVLRATREVITMELRRQMTAHLGPGLAIEGFTSGYGVWR
jgi:enoyl-CoA hydratase/carnithine racemase